MDLNDFSFPEVLYDSLHSMSDFNDTSGHSPTFDDMMEKISKHIEKFQDKEFRKLYFFLLPHVVRRSEMVEVVAGLDKYMCESLQTHKDSVTNLETVIKILNVILKTTTAEDELMLPVPQRVLCALVELLMYERNSRAIPGLIECLKLQIQNSKNVGLVTKIWEKVLQGISENKSRLQVAQTLIEFSDYFEEVTPNFFKHNEVIRLIQELLLEDSIWEQKYGLHLLGMVIQIIKRVEPLSLWELDYSRENNLFWSTYLELMKALIEHKLEALQPLLETIMNSGFKGVAYENWRNVLFIKMLKSKNIAINRLAVEWILDQFKWVDLNADLLNFFTKTLNSHHLYNYEVYFLPEQNIGKFLDCDCQQLLESLENPRWKSVPFHYWLKQLNIHKHNALNIQNLSKELIMKIAAKVRAVENASIRRLTITVFEKLFDEYLKSMSVADHITLMEILYEIGDCCSKDTITVLLEKFRIVTDDEVTDETFSKRLYEIISVYFPYEDDNIKFLLEALAKLSKEKHGRLRFLLVFDTPAERLLEISDFCRLNYELNLEAMMKFRHNALYNEFLSKLGCKENETDFVYTKSLNFFADHRLKSYNNFARLQMSVADFLERGDYRTIEKLCKLLSKPNSAMLSKDFDLLLSKIKTNIDVLQLVGDMFFVIRNLSDYCKKNYPDLQTQYAEKILNLDLKNSVIAWAVLISGISLSEDCYKRGLLLGEPKTGEERIEEIYFIRNNDQHGIELQRVRNRYTWNLDKSAYVSSIVTHLLSLNKDLNAKVIPNQALCLEHRQQMRIGYAISSLICNTNSNAILLCSNQLWEILLEQKPRPSLRYLYELLTALNSPDMQRIKEQLRMALQYDETRQLSVISVAFCYCALRLNVIPQTEIDEVINLLLALTMNANPKSRQHAQMAIVLILEKCADQSLISTQYADLLTTIKLAMGNEFSALSENVRFIMPTIYESEQVCGCIFYITNEPYDEYERPYDEIIAFLENSRILYAAENSENIQTEKSNITSFDDENNENNYMTHKDNGMRFQDITPDTFVVASLVENVIPIKRHCNDFDFENLILSTELTEESLEIPSNALNLVDKTNYDLKKFLSEKRDEGYKIIGGEYTIGSIKPLQFKYPGKCVLLLGHEKNGIPANLFHLLDFCIPLSY